MAKKPVGKINERLIELGCNQAIDAGVYTFTLHNTDPPTKVPARYTYTYDISSPNQDDWKITSHHSSGMPEKPAPASA